MLCDALGDSRPDEREHAARPTMQYLTATTHWQGLWLLRSPAQSHILRGRCVPTHTTPVANQMVPFLLVWAMAQDRTWHDPDGRFGAAACGQLTVPGSRHANFMCKVYLVL
jgi:hypothetical protein